MLASYYLLNCLTIFQTSIQTLQLNGLQVTKMSVYLRNGVALVICLYFIESWGETS